MRCVCVQEEYEYFLSVLVCIKDSVGRSWVWFRVKQRQCELTCEVLVNV